MRNRLIASAFALAMMSPAVAIAQGSTAAGAVGGAAVGAVVGGPVGAVIGGVAGASIGAAGEPPAEVRSYVVRERQPSVRVEREVVVGEPLPDNVRLYTIPDNTNYEYSVVNDRRVIVEPRTRKVIQIIE